MTNMNALNLEYRWGIIFGILALVLSSLLGVLTGNSLAQILLRSLILSFVFVAVGSGAVMVIKKYVPEVYELLTSASQSSRSTDSNELPSIGGALPGNAANVAGEQIKEDLKENLSPKTEPEKMENPAAEEPSDGFVPLKEEDYKTYSTAKVEEGKLGKHILTDKKLKYEPKIVAEAIRTMMGKDKE